jgi:hypothetical protein
MAVNGITDPDSVYIGQLLDVAAPPPAVEAHSRTVTSTLETSARCHTGA